MKLTFNNAHDDNGIVVRWLLNGEYGQGFASAEKGVEVPDGATIIDIALTGVISGTPQVVFDPAWSEYFAEEAA